MTETSTSPNIWGQLLRGVKRRVEVGQRHGRLTVISHMGCYDKWKGMNWRCLCDCGRETMSRAALLLNGQAKSCGCLRKGASLERLAMARAALALNPTPKGSDGKFIPRHNRDTNQKGPYHG